MPRPHGSLLVLLGATLFSAGLAPPALSQHSASAHHSGHSHSGTQRLGKVEFKIDCNAAAQAEFNRAMALYHSFSGRP